jgi:hypothetical protein
MLGGAQCPRWYCCFHVLGMACNIFIANSASSWGTIFLSLQWHPASKMNSGASRRNHLALPLTVEMSKLSPDWFF